MEESEGKLLSKARRETGGTFSKGEGGGREWREKGKDF